MIWLLGALFFSLWAVRKKFSAKITAFLGAAFLLLWTTLANPSALSAWIVWAGFIAGFASWLHPQLRQKLWLTAYRGMIETWVQPQLSGGDREAATRWWEAELMSAEPNWVRLAALPPMPLSEQERQFLNGTLDELFGGIDFWQTRQAAEFPEPVWELLLQKRFQSLFTSVEAGGLGFSATAISDVLQRLAASPAGNALALSVVSLNSVAQPLIERFPSNTGHRELLNDITKGSKILVDVELLSDSGHVTNARITESGIEVQGRSASALLAPRADAFALLTPISDSTGQYLAAGETALALLVVAASDPNLKVGKRQEHSAPELECAQVTVAGHFPHDVLVGGVESLKEVGDVLEQLLIVRQALIPAAIEVGRATACWASASAADAVHKTLGSWSDVDGFSSSTAATAASRLWTADCLRRMIAMSLDLGERPQICARFANQEISDLCGLLDSYVAASHGSRLNFHGPEQVTPGMSARLAGFCVPGSRFIDDSLHGGRLLLESHPTLSQSLRLLQTSLDDARLDELHQAHRKHHLYAAVSSFWLALGDRFPSLGLGLQTPISDSGQIVSDIQRRCARYSANLALLAEYQIRQRFEDRWGDQKELFSAGSHLPEMAKALFAIFAALHRHQVQRRPLHEEAALALSAEMSFQRIEQLATSEIARLPSATQRIWARLLVIPFGLRSTRSGARWRWALAVLARDSRQPGPFRQQFESMIPQCCAGDEKLLRAVDDAQVVAPILSNLNAAVLDDVLDFGSIPDVAKRAASAGLITQQEVRQLENWLSTLAPLQVIDEFTDAALRRANTKRKRQVQARSSAK